MDFLAALNDEQRRAALTINAPVLVIAGPGTGKTKTLVAHAAYIISEQQVDPSQILVLAFTKKTAEEVEARLHTLLPNPPPISTFHALCYRLLGSELPLAREPERMEIIRHIAKPAGYKGISVRELVLIISKAKNTLVKPEASTPVGRLVKAYDTVMQEQGLLDFDDLLSRAFTILKENPDTYARFAHVLIDEFQDTNYLQYELLKLLCKTTNLFAIGDPKQSIYGFRGASGGIFEQFRSDFPETSTITLTTNYRSRPEIVALGNAVFPGHTQLTAYKTATGQARTIEVYNEYSEADWVLDEIQRAVGGSDMLRATSDDAGNHRALKEFAILYRNRSAATVLQKRIAESGLPYQIVGEGSPYERPQIQAIIQLLRGLSRGDMPAIEGLTPAERQALYEALGGTQESSPHVVAERIISLLGYELSAELQSLVGVLVRFPDLHQAVSYFDKLAETDFYDPDADAITLLTIHASKGLEFPHVFLIACEDDILPYPRADASEEKRLFYVAITRAQDRLDITYAGQRGAKPKARSRFLNGIKATVLPRIVDPSIANDRRAAMKRAAKRSQQTLF